MELKIEYLPIEALKPYEKNPRYNKNAVDYVAKSIKDYGFKVPIIIEKKHDCYRWPYQIGSLKKAWA